MEFMDVTDLNVREAAGFCRERFDAFWEVGVCSTDGAAAAAHIPALRGEVPESLSDADVLAFGSILVHGLCTDHLSREPARHRDLLACALGQALSLGHPWRYRAQHACRCERDPRLAHLSGFCFASD